MTPRQFLRPTSRRLPRTPHPGRETLEDDVALCASDVWIFIQALQKLGYLTQVENSKILSKHLGNTSHTNSYKARLVDPHTRVGPKYPE
jgi:hypothetical protein